MGANTNGNGRAFSTPIYLAGPFFTSEQRACMFRIEDVLAAQNFQFISPRFQHGGSDTVVNSALTAHRIFSRNLVDLDRCQCMLATIDSRCAVLDDRTNPTEEILPDSGTVWEIGYAYAMKKRIILFTESTEGRLNLMLTQCTAGVLYGWDHLQEYFQGTRPLSKWEGDYV